MANWDGFKSKIAIESESFRPCIVEKKGLLMNEALFHRWIFEDEVIIKFDARIQFYKRLELAKSIKDEGVIPDYANLITVKKTYGLVEFRDGMVYKIEPECIRFLDSDSRFEPVEGAFCLEKEMNLVKKGE